MSTEPEIKDEPFDPAEWLSADETIRRVRVFNHSPRAAETVFRRAHAGLLRAWAEVVQVNRKRYEETTIPDMFWWWPHASSYDIDWATGDLTTTPRDGPNLKMFGLRFFRADVDKIVPQPAQEPQQPSATQDAPRGRPRSELWPDWVAELAALIQEEGVPSHTTTAEELIERIASRLAERGLEGPTRSTVQETVRRVLRRLREAGK